MRIQSRPGSAAHRVKRFSWATIYFKWVFWIQNWPLDLYCNDLHSFTEGLIFWSTWTYYWLTKSQNLRNYDIISIILLWKSKRLCLIVRALIKRATGICWNAYWLVDSKYLRENLFSLEESRHHVTPFNSVYLWWLWNLDWRTVQREELRPQQLWHLWNISRVHWMSCSQNNTRQWEWRLWL